MKQDPGGMDMEEKRKQRENRRRRGREKEKKRESEEILQRTHSLSLSPPGFKLWRRRWFSLVKGNQLMYWETSDTAQASNPPLGTIHLSTVMNILPEHHASKHIFNIDTPDRVYVLQVKEVKEVLFFFQEVTCSLFRLLRETLWTTG
jgi:hypothetical protein